jgi:hypothetical protein
MSASPSGPEGWKVAIAIGAAIVIAPVIVLALFVLLVVTLPVLPFLATLLVGGWVSRRPRRPRSISAPLPVALRPSMRHSAAR